MTKLILVLRNFRAFFNRFDSKLAKRNLTSVIANFVTKLVQVGSQFDVYDVRKSGNIRKFEHYTLVSIIPSRNKFLGIAVKDYANAYNSFFNCFPT